jgi:hypothetical protein
MHHQQFRNEVIEHYYFILLCQLNLNRCPLKKKSYYLALRYYLKLCCSFQKENDELKYQVHTLEEERQVLKQTIIGLQWDILQLKKEMSETESERARERDSIVQNKVQN